jgi:PAS domain S-box-containing protein
MPTNNESKIDMGDILIVDDEIPNLQLLTQLLSEAGYQVRPAERPQMAIESALAQPPGLILLDVRMPEMDGFEVCRRLKQEERTRDIPVIFVSALQDVQDRIRGFEAGGVDFISKPFQELEVLARVRTHLALRNMQLHLEEMVAKGIAEALEREERFRATFEQAAVGIAHVSPEGRFLRTNQKFCDIVGYSEEKVLDLTFQDITHPDDLDADLEYVRQVLAREIENYSMDKRYYRKDGSIVWVNLTVSLLFDDGEYPKYFVAVIKDISDTKQAEEDNALLLHNLGERLKELRCMYAVSNSIRTRDSLGEVFQDTVSAIPPGWHYPEITRGRLSFNKKDWVSEPFEETAWKQSSDIIIDGQKLGTVEVYYLEERPILDEGPFMKEERNLINGIAQTLTEAIERKRVADDLIKSETKYRGLVDNSIVGVFNTDISGQFIFVNKALARMFEFDSPEQMVVEGALARWEDPNRRELFLNKLQEKGHVSNYETETITHSGRHIHVLLSAILDGDNISGMLMDITDRRRTEQKLLDYQQRLKALASQLTIAEEKERRAIAIDLHDHVGQSLALARVQLASARQSASESKLADKLDDISNTLLKTLEDTQLLMLELSSPAMHETGLSSAISEWLESQIGNRHSLKTEVIDNIPDNRQKTLDPNVRTILFRNVRELLVNVVKHAHANRVSVRLEDRNTSMRIIVEDDGIGFEPRAVTQAGSKIGGFGLFSIEELMADLDGDLKIVSEPGKGCTAILSVPFGVDDNQERNEPG